ncbi:lytic transglycosylase domain-containing protein [Capillimicrobium parvum]|uniref:Membrane-bound lytic murein transglycosylase F n=1 Tax=Capillimicrobium parvum TaxID=2884022 RepID=A0A9E6XZL9_9ACTN|nr:lytic transglycosylase domain-containing protein [Capillimicrobium parvum]UGS37457.1 Membrane-bound lytic murein transglycosylase F [Capillimicrobium parvum]
MSTRAAPQRRSAQARRRTAVRRRRLAAVGLLALIGALLVVFLPSMKDAAREITLPLHHEDIIRQQAADKHLDAALIAGVIYAESKFSDQTSHAGARGLMQITPDTADAIAQRTGGVNFKQEDLADPQVNISYGAWYLRHMLDRYGDNVVLALAAYNAGQGNVDKWIARAREQERDLTVKDIPFAETRAYIDRVLQARDDYRSTYPDELGL